MVVDRRVLSNTTDSKLCDTIQSNLIKTIQGDENIVVDVIISKRYTGSVRSHNPVGSKGIEHIIKYATEFMPIFEGTVSGSGNLDLAKVCYNNILAQQPLGSNHQHDKDEGDLLFQREGEIGPITSDYIAYHSRRTCDQDGNIYWAEIKIACLELLSPGIRSPIGACWRI